MTKTPAGVRQLARVPRQLMGHPDPAREFKLQWHRIEGCQRDLPATQGQKTEASDHMLDFVRDRQPDNRAGGQFGGPELIDAERDAVAQFAIGHVRGGNKREFCRPIGGVICNPVKEAHGIGL